MFWIHFKKVGAIISSEISLNARVIHKTISSSNGFFWWSVTVKAWIPSAIHCIQPFHYCRNTKCNKTEANLRGTRATVDWSSRLKQILQSHLSHSVTRSSKCHKRGGFPSHHIRTAELQNTHSLVF